MIPFLPKYVQKDRGMIFYLRYIFGFLSLDGCGCFRIPRICRVGLLYPIDTLIWLDIFDNFIDRGFYICKCSSIETFCFLCRDGPVICEEQPPD